MARAYIQPKQNVLIDGVRHTILRNLGKDEWQLEIVSTGRILTKFTNEILELLVAERLEFELQSMHSIGSMPKPHPVDMALIPEARREEAKVRYAYVMAVKSADLDSLTDKTLNPVIAETASRLESHLPIPHWVTVYRWHKRFIDGGEDIRALVRITVSQGRKPKYPPFVVNAVNQAIDKLYMSEQRQTIKDTLDHAIHLVAQENKLRPTSDQLPMPTRYIVKAAIDSLPAFDVAVARKGRQAALREFRSVLGINIAERPLEQAEIDHTILDIIVVDENTMLPLGRPTLTICIDSMTRCILGFYIGFEPPSHSTVAQCLKHCFLPKIGLKDKFSRVKNEWECYGVMETLVVDNGLEFHSHSLDALSGPFGINIQFSPRKKPWFKPYVERAIGTLNHSLVHKLPGTTFANIFDKGDYDALKKATITLSTLTEIITIWVVDYYHQSVHSGTRQQPAKAWRENMAHIPVPLPANVRDLDALTGQITQRKLSHKGVELNKLFYNSKELTDLRYRLGSELTVTVRYNDNNLGHIFVVDPITNELLKTPALNSEYAEGLTKWQNDVCRKYATQVLERSDIEALAEAKETIRELIQQDFDTKKIKTRKGIARFSSEDSQNQSPPPNSLPIVEEEMPTPSAAGMSEAIYTRKKLGATIEDRTSGYRGKE